MRLIGLDGGMFMAADFARAFSCPRAWDFLPRGLAIVEVSNNNHFPLCAGLAFPFNS